MEELARAEDAGALALGRFGFTFSINGKVQNSIFTHQDLVDDTLYRFSRSILAIDVKWDTKNTYGGGYPALNDLGKKQKDEHVAHINLLATGGKLMFEHSKGSKDKPKTKELKQAPLLRNKKSNGCRRMLHPFLFRKGQRNIDDKSCVG